MQRKTNLHGTLFVFIQINNGVAKLEFGFQHGFGYNWNFHPQETKKVENTVAFNSNEIRRTCFENKKTIIIYFFTTKCTRGRQRDIDSKRKLGSVNQ